MKKKISMAIVGLFTTVTTVFGQYTFDWEQNASLDQKQSVMSTIDSLDNIIVTGYLQNNQIFTRKYNISGTFLWETTDSSGINSIYEKSNWVSCDANNNVFVIGNLYSYSSSLQLEYPESIVALKYSPTGSLLWRTIIPISTLINSTTSFDCRSVVDASGNLYIGTAIVGGVFLYKIDTNGNLIFSNSSQVNNPKNFNGMRIRNNKIAIVTSSPSQLVAPVFVWNTSGTLLWTADAGGAYAADVEIDENENVYVLSSLYYMPNPITWDYDPKLSKYSPTGSLLWSHTYAMGGYNFVHRMTYVNNRISAMGYGNASGIKWFTFQTDTNGTLLWSSPYNEASPVTQSDSYPKYIIAKPTGEVIVTGVGGPTPDPNNSSFNQMPIIQYSNTGVQNWVSTPNIYAGTGLAIMFASDGSLFAIGSRNMYVFHYDNTTTSISDNLQLPTVINIFPNPFSYLTTLSIEITKPQNTSISIFDVFGRLVKTISANKLYSGRNEIVLDLIELNSGIYFCSVKSDNQFKTVKIIKK